ncbi:hypothetical protein M5689_025455 [Euphorbia peplus]|nr:hypothetical protein M5689_025455 [Euphorbia peplus]
MEKNDVIIELDISEYSNFELEKAICNHGFFMMAPNLWISETKTFERPVRLDKNSYKSVLISISQPFGLPSLHIRVHTRSLTLANRRNILHQVKRMLRLSEKDENDVREFQKIHKEAKEKGFGRLFRSPSLFEDVVKSILLINCTWNKSLQMAADLCNIQPLLASMLQDRMDNSKSIIGKKETKRSPFPTPKELIMADEAFLQEKCTVGYRARTILQVVRSIENGYLKLDDLDKQSYKQVATRFLKFDGIGPFANSCILMCIGFYHQVPIDTETVRLVKKVHVKEGRCIKKIDKKYVAEIYDRYEPFQGLAYWVELINDYETRFGKLSELPSSCYHTVNGRNDTIT